MAIIINIDVMLAKRKMSGTLGEAKAIQLSTLEAICKALECQPRDIIEYKSDEDTQEY